MDKNVKAVFEQVCKDIVPNARLGTEVMRYRANFVNKNEDHVAFFGGHLFGAHVVRFTPADNNAWYSDVLQADELELEDRLHALPSINPEWNVSSDTFNLSCIWLAHAFITSKVLKPEVARESAICALLVLQYKFFTSRLFRHFKYPTTAEYAEATYAALSNKYDIKQYGSWNALFRGRAEQLLEENDIHYKTLRNMDNDADVVYMLNDIQGRIRNMLKNIYDEFRRIHSAGIRVSSTTSLLEHDGQIILKDKKDTLGQYQQYFSSIVTDRNSLIKHELIDVIAKLIPTLNPKLLEQLLEWVSDNYSYAKTSNLDRIISNTLVHSFGYMTDRSNKSVTRQTSDLAGLLSRLKGVYMSSRSTDPMLLEIREDTEALVTQATRNKNKSVVAAVRTGFLLYCVARTITMSHYSSAMVK